MPAPSGSVCRVLGASWFGSHKRATMWGRQKSLRKPCVSFTFTTYMTFWKIITWKLSSPCENQKAFSTPLALWSGAVVEVPIDGSFHFDVMQVPFFLRRPRKRHCCTSPPQLYVVFLLSFLIPKRDIRHVITTSQGLWSLGTSEERETG